MLAQNRFKTFLTSRNWTDPLGPLFVDHAQGDSMLPDAESWEELEAYLNEHTADLKAVGAARYVWQQYEAAIEDGTV